MQTFDTLTDARNAIMDYRAEGYAALPDTMKPRFRELSASPGPVEQIVWLGEFLWANRDVTDSAADALAAGLMAFATTQSWHGLGQDDRGSRIVMNLRKDMGEVTRAPAAPDPLPGFAVERPPVLNPDEEPAA